MFLWPALVVAVGCGAVILWQHVRQGGSSVRPVPAQEPLIFQSSPAGVMGTEVHLTAVAPPGQEKKAARALEEAEAVLRDVEAHMSTWLSGTELSLLNSAPAGEVVELSEPTMEVLRLARRLATESDGAFDVTCRPIIELWKQAGKDNRLPGDQEIAQARQATGWQHIELLERGARKKIAQAGVDLGGIAKGYSSDQAAEAMKATGIASGIVAVAGDIRCFGRGADGGKWRVAIRDPFHTDQTLATLEVGEMGVSTSGNYFRFVRIAGKPYSHIVDPRTGRPVDFAPSVTVIASTATLADAWATGLSVLGHEGLKRIGGKTGIEALVFEGGSDDYKLYATEGFADFLAEGEKLPKPVTIVPAAK